MTILTCLLLAILGASWGSFLNAVGMRVLSIRQDQLNSLRGSGLGLKDRSCCFHCKKQLDFGELVPIASFLFFRGKSKCCHVDLPYRYILSELYFLFLFPVLFLIDQDFAHVVAHIFLFSTLYLLVMSDIFYLEVPIYLLVLAAVSLILEIGLGSLGILFDIFFRFGVGFCVLYLSGLLTSALSGRSSLGAADPIVFGVLSAHLKFTSMPYFLLISSLVGIVWWYISGRQIRIPFVPSIFVAFNLIFLAEKPFIYFS